MKFYHFVAFSICYLYYFSSESGADEYYSNEHDLNYRSYSPGRQYNRPQIYSNTEFEHAVSDSRCESTINIYTNLDETVITRRANIRGRRVSLCDKPGLDYWARPGQSFNKAQASVKVFLGIPYAEPPTRVKNLQFQPPIEPRDVRQIDATKYKPACPQHEKYFERKQGINNTDEDCLYLNIFAPVDKPVAQKYAVMFYIHGGNWNHGSASLFPGHMLAATQDVIVVTFNYRLGHLGFLSTSDEASPGNYGMLDQVLALRWVYENINDFHGDPSRITVFGSGSGGASAALLAISPLSKKMVKRVIAQNGSPTADWAAIVDPLFMQNTSQILGEEVGCSTSYDNYRLVDCIGKRSNNEIKILQTKPRIGWLPWGPVVDNFTNSLEHQFLPRSPVEMLERGVIFEKGFAYMAGINRDEGASIFMEDYSSRWDLQVTPKKFEQKIRNLMKMYNYSVNAEGIFNAINFMYNPAVDPFNETLLQQEYIHLLTDRYYLAPLEKTLHLMTQNKVPVYAYVLNYTLQGFSKPLKDAVSWEEDYLLLSGAPFLDPLYYPPVLNLKSANWSQEDRNMSQFMMEAWAHFAKEGNPTPKRLLNTILWQPLTEREFVYLNVNATNTTSTMISDYRQRESRFWNTFLPFFIGREPPTLAPTLEPGLEEVRTVATALWGSTAVAIILVLVTLICCLLYCRIRSKDTLVEDLNSSREVIVNHSAAQQDTTV